MKKRTFLTLYFCSLYSPLPPLKQNTVIGKFQHPGIWEGGSRIYQPTLDSLAEQYVTISSFVFFLPGSFRCSLALLPPRQLNCFLGTQKKGDMLSLPLPKQTWLISQSTVVKVKASVCQGFYEQGPGFTGRSVL